MTEVPQKVFVVIRETDCSIDIVGLFSTKDNARWYIDQADDRIYTFRVDDYVLDGIMNRPLHEYSVEIDIGDDSAKIYLKDDDREYSGASAHRRNTTPLISPCGKEIYWCAIYAVDKDQALAIAKDTLSRLKADNKLHKVSTERTHWELVG